MSTVSEPRVQRTRPAVAFKKPTLPPPRAVAPQKRGSWSLLGWVAGIVLLAGSLLGARHVLQVGGGSAFGQPTPPPTASPTAPSGVIGHGYFDTDMPMAALAPLVPGRVVEVLATEGVACKKGDRLLRVDDAAAVDAEAQAEIAVRIAETDLANAKQGLARHALGLKEQEAAIEAAERKAAAAKADADSVYKTIGVVASQEQYNAKLELVAAARAGVTAEKAKLDSLKAARPDAIVEKATQAVELAKSRLAEAKRRHEDFIVTAPDDGMVLRVGVAVGTVLGPQSRTVPILFVPSSAKRFVRVDLDQEVVHRVKPGYPAEVFDKYDRSVRWKGKVVSMAGAYLPRRSASESLIAGNDAKTLECIVELEPGDPDREWPKLGQPLNVTIHPVPLATTAGK
ncbi:MAG: hypothetical protein U0746_08560 [Gemmataceae bacterium]